MRGTQAFTPQLLYRVSLEDQVPADHLLRRVARAVDCGFVRRPTARLCSRTGRPSVDPVVLFETALLGYLYGITSERRPAGEIRLNPAYRWFVGYDLDETPPDHAVLSEARARFGVATYRAFFTGIVRRCERAGLLRGDLLSRDGTLGAADARLGSVGARALVAQLAGPAERVAALRRENPPAPCRAEAAPPH